MIGKTRVYRREPASGRLENLLLLLHGYGADGNDLIGLADFMAPQLPDTLFLAPDAPEPNAFNPLGRQWFPIPSMDGASEAAAAKSLSASTGFLEGLIGKAMEEAGVDESRIVLLGFSQGTMLALHIAARWQRPFAGVIGFSGRLLAPENLRSETVSRPPIMLLHGDSDEVVPVAALSEAASKLTEAGFSVRSHIFQGIGHQIDPEGLARAVEFARDQLKGRDVN
ncbi:MAG: dienelactone hydrolase family protein [Rhodobacteraceae bacterium]|nr:dienelactone hydrolase family protein [Paracoccaceae bacterium]